MSDGAHFGVDAERALETILGGKPAPGADEQMDPQAFEAYIRSAPEHPGTYGDCARFIARLGLEMVLAHPEIRWVDVPASDVCEYPPTGTPEQQIAGRKVLREGFGTLWKRVGPASYERAMNTRPSGFMWGWAVNAIRRCCELGPVANPALVTVEVPGEADR